MNVTFRELGETDLQAVVDLFNYYVKNSFAAYPETEVPYSYFDLLFSQTEGYPRLVACDEKGDLIGFGFLRPYSPSPTLSKTALISYFLAPEWTGHGIGTELLERLKQGARRKGLRNLLASISSRNEGSLRFHARHGFRECGRFVGVGEKNGQPFDDVWMQLTLEPE